jgi:hypothetical protein
MRAQVDIVARLNLEHLVERYPELQSESQRAYVKRLLVREQARLARASDRVEIVSELIDKTEQRIRNQQRLVTFLAEGPGAKQAGDLLENLEDLRSSLLDALARADHELKSSTVLHFPPDVGAAHPAG